MTTSVETQRILIRNVRLNFPSLYTPTKDPNAGDNVKPKFQSKFLVDKKHPQIKELQGIIKGQAKAAGIKSTDKTCLRDGADTNYEPNHGSWILGASNPVQPRMILADKSTDTGNPEVMLNGAIVNVMVDIYHLARFGRICAKIVAVQHVEGGGFGKPVDLDEFEVVGEVSAETTEAMKEEFGAF